MAPKKDPKGGKQAPAAPEVSSLYQKREPLPPLDPPSLEEIEDAWKATRDAFVCPLPEWDADDVNKLEWNCNEVETLYSNEQFSAKLLPKQFTTHVAAWKRAAFGVDTSLTEEPAPEVKPPVEKEPVEKAEAPKAKAKPAAKDAKGAPPMSSRATTAQQFADLEYTGEACVVSTSEFRSRQFELTNDDAMPPISQAIASQLAVIGEHCRLLPRGCFLWELIYPQNEDGMPLYNPNGKYVVKLYVQGRWRQVLIDDIIPVGSTSSGSSSNHAPVLPSSSTPAVIWPQLLSKALLRTFQQDLQRGAVLPAVSALTGLAPFQMPLGWPALQSCHESRPFCCLQMSSKVDLEARQREALMAASAEMQKTDQKAARKGAALGGSSMPPLNLAGPVGPQVPRLGANPVDAVLQFVICELEDDPRQVRVKAATWRPVGGTPRKVVLDVAESEGEIEEDEVPRPDYEDRVSENDDHEHEEEEDEERRSQRSPSGEATVQSARSKDDGQAAEEAAPAEDGGESTEDPGVKVSPWPEQLPPEKMPKSLMLEHYSQLTGGYWVPLEDLTSACDSFLVYMPPNERSKGAILDTTWSKRAEPYVPSPLKLLRVLLTQDDVDFDYMPSPRDDMDIGEEPQERGPPWHKATFHYEPLRLDPLFAIPPDAALTGPGSTSASCILQNLSMWQREAKTPGAPEYIHLATGDAAAGAGPGSACRSVLLPSGEQWYLVLDDALRAGSVLSVHLDGSMLNPSKSLVEFHDPAAFLQERGIFMASMGTTEYAAQRGFSVLAKAEVEVKAADGLGYIQLMSYISDAALRPHLRLSFLRLEEEASPEAAHRCALWSVSALTRTPLLPFMSLPLGEVGESSGEYSIKYLLMLEANVPTLMKGGTFSLQLMMPPPAGVDPPGASEADAPPGEVAEGDEEPRGPLQITDLKVDNIIRWSGETKPNEKLIVLRERLTVPHGAGDATATVRVTVTGLPRVFLRANLMAQLPPTQEMRPKVEGMTPEPFQPGVPIDPKEYNGRQNWLASCKTVVEESGVERVMFPHVLFCEGATYLLDIFIDSHKGPDNLTGGQWFLELFGSGEIEVGADTMEEDLEALVRRSWENPTDDPAQAARKERAAKSRRKWLKKRGLGSTSPEDEEDEPAAAPEKPPEKPPEKGKKEDKRGSQVAAPPAEEVVDVEKQEAEWLAAALERAGHINHANRAIDEFVHMHNDVEPMLVAEDPYTIAPILEDAFFDAEAENRIALQALGMRGLAEVREAEMEITNGTWEKIHLEVETAKEGNAQALENLKQWSDEHAKVQGQFIELREEMRGGLQERYQTKSTLKDLLNEAEMLDPARLQAALDDAERTEVGIWDQDLVETVSKKKTFIESWDALRERLSRNEAEPLVEAEQEERERVANLISTAKDLQKKLLKKGVPLVDEMSQKDMLKQADAALNPPPPDADIGEHPLDK